MKKPLVTSQIARAKVNLSLHVTGKRADGYHLLDSLVAFADLGDELSFVRADHTSLDITGRFGAGLSNAEDNLVLRAAELFASPHGAQISLRKNLPVASGIGGGSADAAATLRGLSELWQAPIPAPDRVLALGADVPVCLAQTTVRMQGIGEELTPLSITELPCVLVNPGVGVPTAQIFGRMTETCCAPMGILPEPKWGIKDTVAWLGMQRNDLQSPAVATAPIIADCLGALKSAGAGLARMSGSGATCFGIFATQTAAEYAADQIAAAQPKWWVRPTTLGRAI